MRKFTKLMLVFVFSLSAAFIFGQANSNTGAATPPDTTIIIQPASSTSTSDTVKRKKDWQNQTQFFQEDMKSKYYNFYDRKAISQPLQPRYDMDSAPFQRGKKRDKQQKAYLAHQYAFPARPKDAWELGLNFGSAYISGNVKPFVTGPGVLQNVGLGFTVRKAISYVFSIRAGYDYMCTTGRNWQPDQNLEFNQALNGTWNPKVNYYNNPLLNASQTLAGINMNKIFFYNYRAYIHEGHLDAIFNLGNINFHRERNMVNFYGFAGVSGFFFTTYMDALNRNGVPYDFSQVMQLYEGNLGTEVNARVSQRKEALKLLSQIYNGNNYTVIADHPTDKPGIKNWEFEPSASVGLGMQFHVSKWVTLGIEERVIFTQAHIDGYMWQQDQYPSLVNHYDNISYTSININIHLMGKKRTEPLYWLNPVYHAYRKLGEVDPAAMLAEMFKDDDDDGVPNYLDREPNTPKGCPVDAHGVALDSDHDGIIDCLDKEPFSPPGYPVDSNGVAIIPPNPCCDTSSFSGRRVGKGGEEDTSGTVVTRPRRGGAGYDCSKIELPSIVFDEDKYYIDPQYFGNLHQIAERMLMCPDMKVVVTGFDESHNDQKYNEQLGWNRANAATDYLVEKYGISRDRFIVKYIGGKKAAGGTPYERKMKNKVDFRYANEGETGESNPPTPHPGLKAGSNK
jgi:OmpA-OmpF porin, OOP family